MGSGIKQSNLKTGYRIVGVFATAAAYLSDRNVTSASEGDIFYNTTNDRLETYDGSSWSPAGMSGIGPGSLDAAANIGTKITIDAAFSGGIEIEATDAIIATDGQLLLLDNDDVGSDVHCLELTNAGSAPSIQITGTSGDDIQGTADAWAVTTAGLATFGGGIDLLDDDNLRFGTSQDVVIDWNQTNLLIEAATQDTGQIRIGSTNAMDLSIYASTNTQIALFDVSTAILEMNGWDINLQDDDILQFGDSNDVTLTWDQTNLLIEANADDTGAIRLGSTNSMDLSIYGSTNTNIALWDVSTAVLELNGWDINLQDDDILQFGDAADVTITWDQTKLVITGDDQRLDFGVSGAGFDMYWMTEDTGNYIFWDEDNSRMDLVDVDLRLDDDARLYFGSDADVYFGWDNTNGELDFVGNLNITGTLTISGAFDMGNIAFGDDEELRFGNSSDFVFHYDSVAANLLIDAAAANDIVDFGSSIATDLILHGTTATYDVHWDSSENTLGFLDDAVLSFGGTAASPDVEIMWDQTKLKITGNTKAINFGIDDQGMDVLFYGATIGAYMLWDESVDQLVLAGATELSLNDGVEILFGTGAAANVGDFKMYTDGTDLFIQEVAAAAGLILKLGASGKGLDVQFYGDNATYDMLWDQSANSLLFADNAKLALGTGSDVTVKWDATNLLIEAATEDTGVIKIGATNAIDLTIYNSGTTQTSYASFDCGAAELILDGYDLGLQDDDILQFGDANDITMTWDQSKLVVDGLTVDTAISIGQTTNLDLVIYGDTSTDAVTFDTSAEDVQLNGFDLTLQDDDILNFGDADDISIKWDQSKLVIDGATTNTSIAIGLTNNQDILIYGDNTNKTDIVTYDTSAELVKLDGFDLQVNDGDIIQFGDAGTTDCYITWDATRLQIVPSSNVFIGDKTNYVSISSAGVLTQTGTATIVCNLNTTSYSGLVLPTHATLSPKGVNAGTTGAIMYEQDASVLWVCASGTTWLSTAALS
uniref:Uncharacterized protein n=1 Tax=viral metagenome TaxID=1070528 RepID=A0A6M3XKI9_9ZZZZ